MTDSRHHTLAFAHRGLCSAVIPENSIAACAAAVQKGYGIECDVRVSKDGSVIVFHDATLRRMTGKSGRISNLHYADFCDSALGEANETIPLLEDVLKIVDGHVPLNIELKTHPFRAKRDAILLGKIISSYEGQLIVSSFSAIAVQSFLKQGFCSGYIFRERYFVAWVFSVFLWFLTSRNVDFLMIPVLREGSFVTRVIDWVSNAPKVLWTVPRATKESYATRGKSIIFE